MTTDGPQAITNREDTDVEHDNDDFDLRIDGDHKGSPQLALPHSGLYRA